MKKYVVTFIKYQIAAIVGCYYLGVGGFFLSTSVADNYWILPLGYGIFLGGPLSAFLTFADKY